jgi:transposase
MKKSINDQLTEIYYFVDEALKSRPQFANWRESNNSTPRFTDAEVMTIALMQGYFGCPTLRQTYQLVKANAGRAFPHLCSYKQWIRRLHALSPLIGLMVLVSSARPGQEMRLFLMDSKPIPLCHPLRHGRVRLLREDGAWFGKTRKGWFFGFKLHAIVNHLGLVIGLVLTPANIDDRDAVPALAWATDGGCCLADWGYRSRDLQDLLIDEADLLLMTTAQATDKRPLISSLRERVETTFSQLWDRFIDRVFSRSWNGLWNTIKLKVLHLNLCLNGIIEA